MTNPLFDPAAGPFRIFAPYHLIAIAVVGLITASLWWWNTPQRPMSETARRRARIVLAVLVVGADFGWHAWKLASGAWTIQTMLPLHLCAITTYLTAAMLLTKNWRLYEFCYFFGIGGASQALLTPAIAYGYPHFEFWLNYIGHGAMFFAPIYLTVVEGFRPHWRSMLRAMTALAIYAIPVAIINLLIGSNYLFIGMKPEQATVLDMLPPWPIYIPILVLIALVVCVLLYLPFAIKDWRAAQRGQALPTAQPSPESPA